MDSAKLSTTQHVTAVISHRVKVGREQGYEAWMKGIIAAAQAFEGHLGVSILRPHSGATLDYIVVLQFDTCDHLTVWLKSDIRKAWIERVQPLITDKEQIQILTGLETWFQLPSQPMPKAPKRYKQALLIWVGVMLVSLLVNPWLRVFLAPLPWFLELALSVAITVLLLSYVIMPTLSVWVKGWLFS